MKNIKKIFTNLINKLLDKMDNDYVMFLALMLNKGNNQIFFLILFIFSSLLLSFKWYLFHNSIEIENKKIHLLKEEIKKRDLIREETINMFKNLKAP